MAGRMVGHLFRRKHATTPYLALEQAAVPQAHLEKDDRARHLHSPTIQELERASPA